MFTLHESPGKRPLYCYIAAVYLGSWYTEMRAFSAETLLRHLSGCRITTTDTHIVITHESEPDNVLLYA